MTISEDLKRTKHKKPKLYGINGIFENRMGCKEGG
jgi:hypothetical protein